MRLSLLALSLLALAGCDSGPGSASRLELVVNQTRFAPGDEALVVLDNDTGKAVSYSPCPVLNVARGRRPVAEVPSDGFCPSILARIEAGQSVPFRVALPETLEAGTYIVTIGVDGQQGTAATGVFEVAPR